ncbi:MAG: type IV pilus modification protein PilV [Gammaproteobacteria bacterium]|nr:type IV pilus modification protein PilV [Gammaproteobacteria bacterium]
MKRKNQGFSLLEVLITVIVTTVGILSMVVLQTKAIQYTQEAVNRDDAASLANDLIEIMRAHKDEFYEEKNRPPASYSYNKIKASSDLYSSSGAIQATAQSCPDSQPQTLMEHAGCWMRKVENRLPKSTDSSVRGKFVLCPSFALDGDSKPVCATGYEGSTIAVQLAWEVRDNACDATKDANEPSICTYTTRVEL